MAGWLSAQQPVGRLIRLPLDLIPRGRTVPILATPARGRRWIVGSGPHSCWLGWNELSKRQHLARDLRPGDVVYDVGANVGSYTILASVLVGSAGRVIAFEPVAENVAYLRSHVTLNRLDNVDVVDAAVGAHTGTSRFRWHDDRLQGRLDPDGPAVVPVVALDEFVGRDGIRPPDCIKIDVEGGELSVLQGAAALLRDVRPVVFLATHGNRVRSECLELLREAGYLVAPIGRQGDEWIGRPVESRSVRAAAVPRADSPLDRLIAPEIQADRLYRWLERIAATAGVRHILEIGASAGAGSTEALVAGALRNREPPLIHSLEVSKVRFAALERRYHEVPFVRCYNLSSVVLERFPSETDVDAFRSRVWTRFRFIARDTVMGWLRADLEYLAKNDLSTPGIEIVRRQHGIEHFDAVLIDGSEFSGPADLEDVYGARYLLLDDIRTFKNHDNYQRLLSDSSYRLLAKGRVRNGFAVFERVAPRQRTG